MIKRSHEQATNYWPQTLMRRMKGKLARAIEKLPFTSANLSSFVELTNVTRVVCHDTLCVLECVQRGIPFRLETLTSLYCTVSFVSLLTSREKPSRPRNKTFGQRLRHKYYCSHFESKGYIATFPPFNPQQRTKSLILVPLLCLLCLKGITH